MKSTLIEVGSRVEQVAELLLNGQSHQNIREYALENQWNISESQLYRYSQKARELIGEQSLVCISGNYAIAQSRYEFLYGQALSKGDLNSAFRALKELHSLQGLSRYSAAVTTDNTIDIDSLLLMLEVESEERTITPEQLQAKQRELQSRSSETSLDELTEVLRSHMSAV